MTPALAPTALDAFVADLTAGGIVTRVLEAWSGGPVHAERLDVREAAPAGVRDRLGVAADTAVAFRRVRLMRGDVLLSQADNWYVPDRLTPEIRAMLADGATPFGIAIAALAPRRITLECMRLAGDPILHLRAIVVDAAGRPLALVDEAYSAAVLTLRHHDSGQ